ncbi:MAG TPA: DUF4142 domain-containing protein [Polyangiaceae bacterium]|nr:DUF4142 domain-containing protein [Polyangiaceae bacterium]
MSAVVATFQISACSGDDDDNGTNAGTGGTRSSGGSSARGGSSGRAGNSGRAGTAGASGRAGQGATGASGGTAGRSGTGGTAGQVTTGGTAGRSATGGTVGRGGTAGQTAGRGGTTAGTVGAGSGGLGEAGTAANAGSGGAAGESGGGGEGGEGGAVAQLSDGEILDVASTANQGEVAEAQVAITRASATAVHDFAQMMITDHTAANANVVAVSTSTGIALTPNPVSVRLMSETQQELSLLNAASGAAFDTLYIGEQITDHQNVLALLNGTLIVEVQNADVRALLESMKTTVQAHLTAAEQIRDSL